MRKILSILIILLIGSFSPLVIDGQFSPVFFDAQALIVFACLVFFFFKSQSGLLRGYWAKPSYIFLLSFLAVNFQYLLDYRLGIKTDSSIMILHPEVLNYCMYLGTIGLASFVIGYSFEKNTTVPKQVEGKMAKPTPMWLLVAIQAAVFLLFMANIDVRSFLSGTAFAGGNERESSIADYFELILYAVNAVIVVKTVMGADKTDLKSYILSFPKVSLAIIGIYLVLRFFSGDRGPVIYTTLLFFFGYLFVSKWKIRLSSILIITILCAVIVSTIGIARSMDTEEDFSTRFENAWGAFSSNGRFGAKGEASILPFTEELGFSFIVNQVDAYAIREEKCHHQFGRYQLVGALNSIPFVPGIIAKRLRPENRSSSGFANYHFFHGYERGWGIGTTLIGDFYLDLGAFGVVIGLFLTGLLFRMVDDKIVVGTKTNVHIFLLLLVLLYSSKAIYVPRSTLLVDLRSFVWGVLLLWGNQLFFRIKRQ